MTNRGRALIVGFALTNLYLMALIGPLVSPRHELIFHLPGSATALFGPVILNVALVWAVLTLGLLWVGRRPRAELLLWSAMVLALPLCLVSTAFGFRSQPVPRWLGWPLLLVAVLLFAVVNLRWRAMLPRFERFNRGLTLGFTFLAIPQGLLLVQMLVFAWQTRHLNPPFQPAPAISSVHSQPQSPTKRVVWVILDELSYEQLFVHRYPGLALPNFDRFAAQATVFSQAVPAAEYTQLAIPAMLTGRTVRAAQPSASGQRLWLTYAVSRQPLPFDPRDSVFGDARRMGEATAIAGWYEPYCRLFSGAVDRCFWIYSDELPGGLSQEGNLLERSLQPGKHLLGLGAHSVGLGASFPTEDAQDVRRHRADYHALLAASDDLLRSGQSGLLLLHMPIPHPWGFFDRRTGAFADHRTSYLDNLVLADAYVGRIRTELEAEHLWDSSTVILMGDHSWRTSLVWAKSSHWTAEEQAASHGGHFDDRPALLVKLPGQTTAASVPDRFEAIRLRSLIDALLRGELRTSGALRAWVAQMPR